jgi:hypothetical protein
MRLGLLSGVWSLVQALPLASALARPGGTGDGLPLELLPDVPPAALGPDLALKTALDRAASTYFRLSGPRVSAQDWRRIAREVERARALYRTRGWLDDPSSFHAAPPDLLETELRARQSRGRSFLHLKFASGYAPHPGEPGRERWLAYRSNRIAHAWVLRHEQGARPWVVCIPGYGMGHPLLDFAGFPLRSLHERLGLNIAVPVLPLHGPRRTGRWSGERFLDGDVLDTIHAEAQSAWDLRRLLSWVRAQGTTAVGVYGISLGAYNAALLAALEPELACVIAGIPAVDLLGLCRLHGRRTPLHRAVLTGMAQEHVAEALRVVAPLAMPVKLAPERLFIFAACADRVVPPDQARELWNHWGQPRLEWYRGGHFSFPWEPAVARLIEEAVAATLPGA